MMRALTCIAGLALFSLSEVAVADTITFGGRITQSTLSATGPAVNNPSLNAIQDNDAYTVVLNFNGSINAIGTYTAFTAGMFNDPAAPASESSFGTISLTIATDSANSSYDDFSLLGCLTTGNGCTAGNQLAASFMILAADLNSQNAAAQAIPLLTPLDLLEDDGTTDIQGTVATYSYAATNGVPEPAEALPISIMMLALAGMSRRLWRG